MSARAPFKRLILRAVLRNVSPMVIRVIAVPDSLSLHELDEVFRSVLGWENIGFIFHMQGLEFSSFRRATRSRTLREFQLRPGETFLYTSSAIRSLGMGDASFGPGNGKRRRRCAAVSGRSWSRTAATLRRRHWLPAHIKTPEAGRSNVRT